MSELWAVKFLHLESGLLGFTSKAHKKPGAFQVCLLQCKADYSLMAPMFPDIIKVNMDGGFAPLTLRIIFGYNAETNTAYPQLWHHRPSVRRRSHHAPGRREVHLVCGGYFCLA